MPIYEYTCSDCGNRFEELIMSRAEAGQVRCPKCESRKVSKVLSAFAVSTRTENAPPACGAGGTCPGGTCPYTS